MKIDFSREEIWGLIGTLDGVWPSERSDEQHSAYEKLERAYHRLPAAPATNVEEG